MFRQLSLSSFWEFFEVLVIRIFRVILLIVNDTWRNIGAHSPTSDHHIGLISSIKRLTRATTSQYYSHLYFQWRYFSDQILNGNIRTSQCKSFKDYILFVLYYTCYTLGYLASRCLMEASCNQKCQRQKYITLFPPDIFHKTVLSFIPHQIAIVPLLKGKMQCNTFTNIFHLVKICKVWRRKFLSTITRKGFCHNVLDLIMSLSSDIISL